jgi:hypothetical protein
MTNIRDSGQKGARLEMERRPPVTICGGALKAVPTPGVSPLPLTRIDTIHVPRLRAVSVRFGRPVRRETISPSQKCHYFTPDSTVALLRWHGNDYGTTLWQLSILRAVWPQQVASTVIGVTPGAEVLLRVSAITSVRWMLSLIRRIEARGIAAADVSPDYWRCVHHRLTARVAVPEYRDAEHAAFLTRLKCIS